MHVCVCVCVCMFGVFAGKRIRRGGQPVELVGDSVGHLATGHVRIGIANVAAST